MTDWIAESHVVDAILALMVLEALVLLAYRRWTGRGVAPASLAATLAAGACLLLVVRALVSGAAPSVLAVLMALALAAHVTDLALRWEGSG
jgi:hypothetical protein